MRVFKVELKLNNRDVSFSRSAISSMDCVREVAKEYWKEGIKKISVVPTV